MKALQPNLHSAVADGLQLEVADVHRQTDSIVSIAFRDPSGNRLPSYVPGSHLVVQYEGGANAYSLTGSGSAPSEYNISVLRIEDGAGGSMAMHRLAVGDCVYVSRPRSAFAPASTATHHVLVAAGIGITPLLSHARYAAQWGIGASLIYSHRPGTGAHVEEAKELFGPDLTECTDPDSFKEILTDHLATQRLGSHLYVCGPAGYMETVLNQARELGWSESRLHSEAFGAGEQEAGEPFKVKLVRSGISVDVPSGVSLLDALERAGEIIPNMCRKGICGECEVPVVRGTPLHRDLYLSDQEKAVNTSIMCCVSRSIDEELELDL